MAHVNLTVRTPDGEAMIEADHTDDLKALVLQVKEAMSAQPASTAKTQAKSGDPVVEVIDGIFNIFRGTGKRD